MGRNRFSLRQVALTVETPNQFLFLIGMLLRSLKTLSSLSEEKHVDDEKKKVGKYKKDKQSKNEHEDSLSRLSTTSDERTF